MSGNIITLPTFEREAKRLGKRYRSLKQDIVKLIDELRENPDIGTDLGGGFRKVRMSIASTGSGKSGGARVITMDVVLQDCTDATALLFIYAKSDRANISDKELKELKKKNGL